MTIPGRRALSRWTPLVLATLLLSSTIGSAAAQVASPSDTTAQLSNSYWGPFPPDRDSVRTRFTDRGMPLWESILVWPYRVISFPVRLVGLGASESIEWLDRTKTLQRVASWLGPRQGPFGVVLELSAGGLPGLGGGATVEHDAFFGSRNKFRLRGTWTLHDHYRVTTGLLVPVGNHSEIELGAGIRYRSNARYFGIGPDALAIDRSYYHHRQMWAAASVQHAIARHLSLGADAVLSGIGTGAPRDDDVPALADQFAGGLPSGYGSTSTGISIGAFLSHETADGDGRPSSGGVRRLRATYFQGVGDEDARFWSYRAELQQFIRLWYPANVLAVRGYVTWIAPVGGTVVPFQRLMTNDDPDLLRGFRDFRWRDRGMVALSAEYRWPVWAYSHIDRLGLDMYLLADVGQVFRTFDEITRDRLTFSYGAGVRLLSRAGFVLRVEYARSGEESVWRLRSDQIFQFAKGSLHHGRDPIPRR